MKKVILTGLSSLLVFGVLLGRQLSRRNEVQTGGIATESLGRRPGFSTDKLIARAQAMISQHPSRPDGYNILASAYLERSRETGDFSLNSRAEAAINKALEIAPHNFDSCSLKALLLLNYHRFAEALSAGLEAQALRPGSPHVYGAIADALVELGQYS